MNPDLALDRTWRRWRAPLVVASGACLSLLSGWYAAQRSPLLVGGGIAGAAAGVWAFRRARVAIVLLLGVIVLLPFGVPPLRLGVAPTFLDLATATLFVVWLARAATGRSTASLGPVGAVLLFYAAALVAAYAFSPDPLRPDETARTFAKLVAAHLVLLPILNLAPDARRVRWIAAALVALAALEALIGSALYIVPRGLAYRLLSSLSVVGYPTGDSVLRYRPDTEILRATGTAVDPNMLGVLLMVAGAIAISQLVAQRPVVPRWLLALAAAPIALCLLLTESRGSWLGLAGGLLCVAGLKYRRLWLVFGLAGVGALFTPYASRFTGHLLSGLQAQDRASSMRLGEIENALEVIARHPWFGVGWGRGGSSIELEFTLGVSNVFLTVAERAGLPAMALYALCWVTLATALWPALKRRIAAPQDDGLFIGLCAALGGAAIAGMVDHHFVRFPHLVTLLWLVAGLAVSWAHGDAESPLNVEP